MITFTRAGSTIFLSVLRAARELSPLVAAATSAPDEINGSVTFYVSDDGASGYGIDEDGTLVSVFSLIRGRGDAIVTDAIINGATKLDCFDGYLPGFYARHGFTVTKREANWTHGEPDVVYMELAA